MKLKLLTTLLITFTVITTLNAQTKRYEVKSGVIEYDIIHSGNMMNMKIDGKGTAKTVFKKWGTIELHTEESERTTMGMKEREKEMTKIEDGKVYSVDFNDKVIYEFTPHMLANSEHKDLIKTGKEMLAKMGGKKIGEEKFMGYTCEVWQMMHVKVWLHKGIMLKTQANIMGINYTTTATKIDLDASVSSSDLLLPNYPIKKANLKMKPSNNPKENGTIPKMTPEQMQQMQELMKNFSTK
jgi:hypothetical protein